MNRPVAVVHVDCVALDRVGQTTPSLGRFPPNQFIILPITPFVLHL